MTTNTNESIRQNTSGTPLVSVIVPLYNAEEYLQKCIESVLTQTYKNFELLLIDDGSTDRSGALCDRYAEKDARIRVFREENCGVASSRNKGVERARGEFVAFVDSDDFVSRHYLEVMVTQIHQYNADMAATLRCRKEKDLDRIVGVASELIDPETLLSRMCYAQGMSVTVWGKLIPAAIARRYPFPDGEIFEDVATIYKYVGDCKTIACSNQITYCYVKRNGSIVNQRATEKHFYALTASKKLIRFTEEHYPGAAQAARFRYGQLICGFMPYILAGTKEDKEVFHRLRAALTPYYRGYWKSAFLIGTRYMLFFTAVMMGYYPMKLYCKISSFAS